MESDANHRNAQSEPPVVAAGDVIADKYRVQQVLGSGGMGVVVAAEHIELREKVAIKFLLDRAADDPELSERFLREARAAVKIKSEHVVRVIDVGRLPSGAPYMVMEYLEGEDLSQRIERGPLPIEDAADFIIQSCEAMNVAHRSGIVHRDLKPANLFLTQRPDGSPIVKVLDFGISKVSSPEAQQLSLTHTQAMMGSPLYMSPEQMRSSKDVDRRADIWSLGVILYELVTGDVPFSGATFPEVLVKVMTDPAPSLRALRPDAPEALDAIVRRCLAKSPADRYSSVAALAVALAPFASARTVGLHARLEQSLSVPAPGTEGARGAAGPALGATRIEGKGPMPALSAVEAGAPGAGAPERLPPGTHTSWEGEEAERLVPPRPKLLRLGVTASLLAIAGGAVAWLRWAPAPPAALHAGVAEPAAPHAASELPPAAMPLPAAPAPAPAPPRQGHGAAPPTLTPAAAGESVSSGASEPGKASDEPAAPATPVALQPEAPRPASSRATSTRRRAAPATRVARQPAPAPARAVPTAAPPPPAPPAEKRSPSRALSIEFK